MTVARHAFRQLRGGAVALGATCGAVAASSALTYVDSFPTAASRQHLADSLRGDAGFSVLFGQVDRIGTVGGYTAYKSYVFLTTIGAIWAALVATRLLRGEEDTGHWQFVLSGRTTPGRATLSVLAGLGAGIGVVFAITAALTGLAGAKPAVGFGVTDSVVFGLSIVVAPLVFASVGAVCSQLAKTRSLATALSVGVLAVAFVIRMIADASPTSRWLLWASPFGWAELMRPFTANDGWPLVPAAVFVGAAAAATVFLAARRDEGDGVLSTSDSSPVRPVGLRSPLGLAARLGAPVLAGWAVGVAAMSFVLGIVTKAAARAVADSGSATRIFRELGANGIGTREYLGVVFLFAGAVLALVPASQIGAARDEEASGRLGHILARAPTRRGWLTGRMSLAAAAVTAMGLLAGVATWAGARSQGVHVGFTRTLLAGVNIVPAALFVLALGALTLAVLPRRAPTVVYVVVGASFFFDLLGSIVTSLAWIGRLSLFHYVSRAPAENPAWGPLAVYTAGAMLLVAASAFAFECRDLAID